MKLNNLFSALLLAIALISTSYAADINLSWDVNTLKHHAQGHSVKQIQLKKYSTQKSTKQNKHTDKRNKSKVKFRHVQTKV